MARPQINTNTVLFSSREEFEKSVIDSFNSKKGTMNYYDCPKCFNKGEIWTIVDGQIVVEICDCMAKRKANKALLESGMIENLQRLKFQNFEATELWQKSMLGTALNFIKNPSRCLFVGGQSGSGKTHICTAVCGELHKKGMSLKYALWRDIVVKLQANIFDDDEYTRLTNELKNIDVLYIDDLFKDTAKNNLKELSLAFKIINDREINDKITIISTELLIADIVDDIDEAIAGRIVKMANGYIVQIKRDKSRNYRLKDLKII